MYQRIQELLAAGHSEEEILYFNFEDDRLDGITLSDLDTLLQCYAELFEHKPFVFLDEIQIVEGWEKFARRLADNKYSVCVTGSNAKMLSKEMATVLGGRFIVQDVFPFSFKEYLSLLEIKTDAVSLVRDKNKIVRAFEPYFCYGGLPELRFAVGAEKRMWLSNLYNKIYFGDLISRYKIRNEGAVKLLIKKIAESVRQPSSYARLANIVSSCGSKVKSESIAEYIRYAEDSWLLFHVENFAAKLAEKESVKKYYFIDNGILNLFLLDPNTSLLENFVAVTLLRRKKEFFYYRTQSCEVDFVIPEEKTAIQACFNMSDPETQKRELSALKSLAKVVPLEHFFVVTKDEEREITTDWGTVQVVSAWKWGM